MLSRARHPKGRVFNALHRPKSVGKRLCLFSAPLNRNDLETIMMVEVDVLGRYDALAVVVLNIHELRYEFALVVVIDNRNCPGDLFPFVPFFLNKFLANQITKRLRAVRVIFLFDQSIELLEQILIKRHAKSYQTHTGPFYVCYVFTNSSTNPVFVNTLLQSRLFLLYYLLIILRAFIYLFNDTPADTSSDTPKQATTDAPVGKSHLAEAKSPNTLTRNPMAQPMASLCAVLLATSIAQVAGTTR